MTAKFKPKGYNSVSPYFIIRGAQKLIDLLKTIFDAEELRRYDNPDGSIMHAEIRIDDSVIMLGDAGESFSSNQLWIHVYVRDVFHTFEKAINAGCESVERPVNKANDPDTRGTFRDFAGNNWSISTQLSNT